MFTISDWRTTDVSCGSESLDDTTDKSGFQEYYKGLKKEKDEHTGDLPSTSDDDDVEEDVLADNEDLLLKQVIEKYELIELWKRRGTVCHYKLGVVLSTLKYMYYKEKRCLKHDESDMYTVLECATCGKINKVAGFFNSVCETIGYKKDYINFLIKVAGLITKFPKLKLTKWNPEKMKKHMVYLVDRLVIDKDIWI